MKMLEGVRVLEVADGLTDFGGRILAELGADVVTVVVDENRDHARQLAWHHGKTGLSADDPEAIRNLSRDADIVLDGQRKGDRFDLASAVSGSDKVIYVRVAPFSVHGPYADKPATDLTLFALSGLAHVTGEPSQPPLRFPGEQVYALTGIQAATAALLALQARRRTGKGQNIDVSAFQSATLSNYREAIMYEWTGRIGRRMGNMLVRGKSGVRQIWPCQDGYVTWSMIDNPSMMRAVVAVMNECGAAGELLSIDWDNTLVADTPQETIERWQGVVERFFADHTREELGKWSLERGWGLSVVYGPEEVRESEHLRERGLFVEISDETTGETKRLPGPLFQTPANATPSRNFSAPIPSASFKRWSA